MFAESLSRLLSDEPDIEVLGISSSGVDAVGLATTLRPAVVLVDYQMPDRDGLAVTADIKGVAPEIMVVMLTGTADDRLLVAAIEIGCSGFLTKDRAASEVASAVRSAAAGEAVISPVLLARLLPKLNRGFRVAADDLTERELVILRLVARASTNQAIADELHLSVNTIRNYMQSILAKLGAHSKLEAVAIAVKKGIVAL
jgi:two-component system response regulator DevR